MKRTRAWPVHAGFALASLASGVCSAQSLAESLSACTSVADEKSRLECYDDHMVRAGKKIAAPGSAARAPSSTSASAPSAVAPPPASVPTPAPKRQATTTPSTSGEFGLEGDALRKKRASETGEEATQRQELTARVTGVSERARGEHRIELDNGQVWEETQRTGGQPPAAGEAVTIKRGAMGSFFLTRKSGLGLRVKRIK